MTVIRLKLLYWAGLLPSDMRSTVVSKSPSVSCNANTISSSVQSGNISLIVETLVPYCFFSWPTSPSSSIDAVFDLFPFVAWGLPPRPPLEENPPRPPRAEPLPRGADGRDCTSDMVVCEVVYDRKADWDERGWWEEYRVRVSVRLCLVCVVGMTPKNKWLIDGSPRFLSESSLP
jgi:hypothetical protein